MYDTDGDQDVADWTRAARFSGADSFIAEGRSPDQLPWTANEAWYGEVPAGHSYALYGATSNSRWSTSGIIFDQHAIDRLRPDLILISDPEDTSQRRTTYVSVQTSTILACGLPADH